jgi:hypothetical protein
MYICIIYRRVCIYVYVYILNSKGSIIRHYLRKATVQNCVKRFYIAGNGLIYRRELRLIRNFIRNIVFWNDNISYDIVNHVLMVFYNYP